MLCLRSNYLWSEMWGSMLNYDDLRNQNHFDLVAELQAHKRINTRQLERTWEQMHAAYERGVDAL
jgi:hypothetical protein